MTWHFNLFFGRGGGVHVSADMARDRDSAVGYWRGGGKNGGRWLYATGLAEGTRDVTGGPRNTQKKTH